MMSEVKFWILVGTPALSSWWFTHLSRKGLNLEPRPQQFILVRTRRQADYLSRIASGDIFIRLSSCSPPSNRFARPGHCSRLIWLNNPILRRKLVSFYQINSLIRLEEPDFISSEIIKLDDCLKRSMPCPKRMNFRKSSERGGAPPFISDPKIYVAKFGPLNRAFSA